MAETIIIATWEMAFAGVEHAIRRVRGGARLGTAMVEGVAMVEDNPAFTSVGCGGLPNADGLVELDASYMDGKSLRVGAVMGVKNVKNPIEVAYRLSSLDRNNILAAAGAERYAELHGFSFANLLTEESRERWQKELQEERQQESMEAYEGHDTVCFAGLDKDGFMATAVSTSGLFMKKAGRVGDSPIIGSGFYVNDRYGAACATGVGEDIMRGCLSYEIVRLMKSGMSPMSAARTAVKELHEDLLLRTGKAGSISAIALGSNGEWGAATNKPEFPFVVGTLGSEGNQQVMLHVAKSL